MARNISSRWNEPDGDLPYYLAAFILLHIDAEYPEHRARFTVKPSRILVLLKQVHNLRNVPDIADGLNVAIRILEVDGVLEGIGLYPHSEYTLAIGHADISKGNGKLPRLSAIMRRCQAEGDYIVQDLLREELDRLRRDANGPNMLDRWEPLPLDRLDPVLQEIIARLESLETLVTRDNGYAATYPAERDDIVLRIKVGRGKLLTDDQITESFLLNFIVKPLKQIVVRFGEAAPALLATIITTLVANWIKGRP